MNAVQIIKPKESSQIQQAEPYTVLFGGVKKSGFGRDVCRYSMFKFVNIKLVRFYDKLMDYHLVEKTKNR